MIIPQKLLVNPIQNKRLVDTLMELDRKSNQILVVDTDPTELTETVTILYNRTDKMILICDTETWHKFTNDTDATAPEHTHPDTDTKIDDTVDEITVVKSDLNGFPGELKNLTTEEIQQLENIGTETVSSAQWALVGAMDQGIKTTDSLIFSDLTITSWTKIGGGYGDTGATIWADGNIQTDGTITSAGGILILNIKSGATQAGAGAAANELWKTSSHATLPDNVVMIGV